LLEKTANNDLQNLGKKSVPRNKLIADLFHRIGEVERAGTGINRIKKLTSDAGLPEPTFKTDSFFSENIDVFQSSLVPRNRDSQ